MEPCSIAYKEEMHERLRDHAYINVSIGVINQEAQKSAAFTSKLAYYSDAVKPLDNYAVNENELYALTDEDYTRADGSMLFLPREEERDQVVLNNGAASKDVLGGIRVSFDTTYDIKGLTIEFGKAYPVDFTITSDNHTQTVTGNRSGHFISDEIFNAASYIEIVPSKMSNGQGKLHIWQITMGVGIYFTERQIKATTKKEHISPVSEDLQTIDFSCTIDNNKRDFDVENEKSTVNFLEVGQQVDVTYIQELKDGTLEPIKGATLQLKEWSANDSEMKFTAVDRFDDLDMTYYRGMYSGDGVSLYDLAIDVFTTAEVDERTYEVDTYLKNVIIHNPIPAVSCKEALQLIANAGRCILYQDRNGKIILKSNFVPDIAAVAPDSSVSVNGQKYFSNPNGIFVQRSKEKYSLVSENYVKTDGSCFFLPRKDSGLEYRETGFISQEVAGADGSFKNNPVLTLQLEADYKTFGMTFMFDENYPETFVLHVYNDDVLQEDVEVKPDQAIYTISHEFMTFDRMDIEFTKGRPNNVVILDNIEFGDATDYELSYGHELLETPAGTQLGKVKTVQFTRTIYNLSTEDAKELAKESFTAVSAGTTHTFYFNNAAYDLTAAVTGGLADGQSIEITGYSNYFATVLVKGFRSSIEVSISGKEYAVSTSDSTVPMNTTGRTEKWSNPLVSDASHAADMLDWLKAYLRSDREYDLEYRGEPRIDGNDVAFLENKYVDKLLVRVYEHTLKYNGAYSGTIKARRDMSYVADA